MGTAVAIILLLTFAAALAAPALHRVLRDRLGFVLAIVPFAAFVTFATMVPAIRDGGVVQWSHAWAPALGISLSFLVDGLSLLFLLVISGIGTFIVWYAAGYLHGDKRLGRFYLYLLSFMGAMLGIVASDHLIVLFIFWELTSITSYLLIGYYNENAASRRAARQALLVTGFGGLAMLAGFLLLGRIAGTYEISSLLGLPDGALFSSPLFPWALGLILLGAFTKSAQFPFHFWLPNAMEAPAPVSAFLHSATMVKAGVFLLARLAPCLDDHSIWLWTVAPIGAVTMITGVFLALGQSDLKRILAYTTLSVLGTLTLLLGLGSDLAIKACVTYLVAHALYKAALFMTAGSVDHETGTRDIATLGGLRRAMPFTAAAALLGALSMAGVPLLLGFVSKEYFYKALLESDGPPYLWEILGVSASIAMFALAVTAGIRPFWGAPRETPKHPHEAPWTMWLGPLLLGGLAVFFGIFPGWIGDRLISPAAAAIIGDNSSQPSLALWHGWNTALFLSIITVVAGLALYTITGRIRATGIHAVAARFGPDRAYDVLLSALLGFAGRLTAVIQNGHLRTYVLTIGVFTSALILWLLPTTHFGLDLSTMTPLNPLGVVPCVLIIAAAVMVCVTKSRLSAIIALGTIGLSIAVLFLLFSAPDLAMTQILVETLTVVLFVLAFHQLPQLKELSHRLLQARDFVLAGAFGALMSTVVILAIHVGADVPRISEYMGENSQPLAHGRNVVNVILVDFRALDTLGEITVLAIAALGIVAMLKLRPRGKERSRP